MSALCLSSVVSLPALSRRAHTPLLQFTFTFTITPKWAWLWSRDCLKIFTFAVMQRVARVRHRQLSYLFEAVMPLVPVAPPMIRDVVCKLRLVQGGTQESVGGDGDGDRRFCLQVRQIGRRVLRPELRAGRRRLPADSQR